MKNIFALALLLVVPFCYGKENSGKVCLRIPERGAEIVKIANNCMKGDIIQLNKIHIPSLCDFNFAIVNYTGPDQYVCVYLGKKRDLREGTN
ncbi:MAG: hypothetical protein HOP23_01660 [Methylococcaceae bacterium]|nr:hypothetical protein [Methylococcaceae bacterium]